jgi:hypothetical protein
MFGPCDTYGGKERCMQGFGEGNLREKEHLEGLGIDGRTIQESILKSRLGECGLD